MIQTVFPGDTAGGYANAHHATYEMVENYHSTQYNDPSPYGTNKRDYLPSLLTGQGSIEFVGRMARYLADLRTGSTGSHVADLTLVDMAQMWPAYRGGIYGETCFAGTPASPYCSFGKLEQFQQAETLGGEAQLGYQFFEYFQEYFNGR